MGNISYFCIVKHFKYFFRCLALLFFLLLTNGLYAQYEMRKELGLRADSVQISLLTCQPRQKIYSLYGHTAIRIEDPCDGIDIVVNYGLFSFDKPFFIFRFMAGLTDYEMGMENFDSFFSHYTQTGSRIFQQVLNLTETDKAAILMAIMENYKQENRTYRYNYFYDNCTTRARDILINNVNGKVYYDSLMMQYPSHRELIHLYNENNRWARLGNDLLLGIAADRATSFKDQQFLPDRLCHDFSEATVVDHNGTRRPLVSYAKWLSPPVPISRDNDSYFTPFTLFITIGLVILLCSLIDIRAGKIFYGLDAVVLGATGLAGTILLMMLFSQHPAVNYNLQILMLNPLNLIWGYVSIRNMRRRVLHWWIPVYAFLLILCVFCRMFQVYAEGMVFLALSLLFRYSFMILQFHVRKQ